MSCPTNLAQLLWDLYNKTQFAVIRMQQSSGQISAKGSSSMVKTFIGSGPASI